jgi:hypothetical protein
MKIILTENQYRTLLSESSGVNLLDDHKKDLEKVLSTPCATTHSSATCLSCTATNCTTCSTGFTGATCTECAEGYQTPSCLTCVSGYYGGSGVACEPCSDIGNGHCTTCNSVSDCTACQPGY